MSKYTNKRWCFIYRPILCVYVCAKSSVYTAVKINTSKDLYTNRMDFKNTVWAFKWWADSTTSCNIALDLRNYKNLLYTGRACFSLLLQKCKKYLRRSVTSFTIIRSWVSRHRVSKWRHPLELTKSVLFLNIKEKKRKMSSVVARF